MKPENKDKELANLIIRERLGEKSGECKLRNDIGNYDNS